MVKINHQDVESYGGRIKSSGAFLKDKKKTKYIRVIGIFLISPMFRIFKHTLINNIRIIC